jgi:hypothetical protein
MAVGVRLRAGFQAVFESPLISRDVLGRLPAGQRGDQLAEAVALKVDFQGEPAPGATSERLLHAGTYEAAIENMLRRMHDQADADSTFYLHRVALRVDPSRVNPGYRDENDEPAAQVTNTDLRREGLEVIRYLNVHEAIGTLSLAVIPETIVAVQSIALPVEGLAPVARSSLTEQLDALEMRLAELTANAPDTSGIKRVDLRMMQLGLWPDPTGIGASSDEHEHAIYELWREAEQILAEGYLGRVSPVIVGDLPDAMGGWRGSSEAGVHEYADHFAAHAALLSHGDAVRASVAQRAARQIAALRN